MNTSNFFDMKLLIIEDEQKTALSLKEGFETNDFKVDVSFNGEDALYLIQTNVYQVIISDIILPQKNGIDVIKQIRLKDIKTPVLLLTALDNIEHKIEGFESGADDYLVKPFAFRELLLRVQALIKRTESPNSNKSISFSDLHLDLEAKTVRRENTNIELTQREFDLLKYLIENQNKIVSKKVIAEEVWDIHFETGTNTIEVYVNYLRNKIDKPFNKKLIHTAHGMGYILKEV